MLVPGFWLGGWAWDDVAAHLIAAGARPQALTLPGLASPDAARAGVHLQDHVDAVLEALRNDGGRPAVLVAHSGACAPVTMAVDQAPGLVRRVVYVESGPLPDGVAVEPGLDQDAAELPLPTREEFTARGTSLEGLDAERWDAFARRAVPHPAGPAREPSGCATTGAGTCRSPWSRRPSRSTRCTASSPRATRGSRSSAGCTSTRSRCRRSRAMWSRPRSSPVCCSAPGGRALSRRA